MLGIFRATLTVPRVNTPMFILSHRLTTSSSKPITLSASSLRIDRIVATAFNLSRRDVELSVLGGYVVVNGVQTVRKSVLVKEGDVIDHLIKERITEEDLCLSRVEIIE